MHVDVHTFMAKFLLDIHGRWAATAHENGHVPDIAARGTVEARR
jgi:hypothetical protein